MIVTAGYWERELSDEDAMDVQGRSKQSYTLSHCCSS